MADILMPTISRRAFLRSLHSGRKLPACYNRMRILLKKRSLYLVRLTTGAAWKDLQLSWSIVMYPCLIISGQWLAGIWPFVPWYFSGRSHFDTAERVMPKKFAIACLLSKNCNRYEAGVNLCIVSVDILILFCIV